MSIKRLWRFPKCWSSLILLMTCRQKKRKEIFFSYVCGHLCGKERKKFFRKNVNLWFFSVNIMIAVVIGKQSFMNQDFVDDNHTHTYTHRELWFFFFPNHFLNESSSMLRLCELYRMLSFIVLFFDWWLVFLSLSSLFPFSAFSMCDSFMRMNTLYTSTTWTACGFYMWIDFH